MVIKNKQSKIGPMLDSLLGGDFFEEGKTVSDVLKKLSQRGFTIEGKKIGMAARMLTQMCQDPKNCLERYEVVKTEVEEKGRWIFKKIK